MDSPETSAHEGPYQPPTEDPSTKRSSQEPSWIIRVAVGALLGGLIGFLTRPIIVGRSNAQLDAMRLNEAVNSSAQVALIGSMLGLASYLARKHSVSRLKRNEARINESDNS